VENYGRCSVRRFRMTRSQHKNYEALISPSCFRNAILAVPTKARTSTLGAPICWKRDSYAPRSDSNLEITSFSAPDFSSSGQRLMAIAVSLAKKTPTSLAKLSRSRQRSVMLLCCIAIAHPCYFSRRVAAFCERNSPVLTPRTQPCSV
jgi:hypothetical protein